MCKCTPAHRTPFCGAPGCEWPEKAAAATPPEPCRHHRFAAQVAVERLVENDGDDVPTGYRADVTIQCADCGEPFVFMGLPMGYLQVQPTISADRAEARLPIAPRTEFFVLSTTHTGTA